MFQLQMDIFSNDTEDYMHNKLDTKNEIFDYLSKKKYHMCKEKKTRVGGIIWVLKT